MVGSVVTVAMLLARAGIAVEGASPPLDAALLATSVAGVHHDSRQVTEGSIFVAVPGARFDGARFAADAAARGAAVVVAETTPPVDLPVPWTPVRNARVALSALAAAFHGDPSHKMLVVGVTGTNGKTTTTYLVESVLEQAAIPSGRIGTVSNRIAPGAADGEQPAVHTTPEAPEVHAMLRAMRDAGARACVLETSSHGLALHRVDHVRFDAGIFTNLTRDHLDFHGGMESYFAAKRRLFDLLAQDAPSVVNVDDPYGARLATLVDRPVTYALDAPADVTAARLDVGGDGTRIAADTPRGSLDIRSPLVGRTNAVNLLAAVAAGIALDLPSGAIEAGLGSVEGVPGRMERVSTPADDISVIVDFAHTDDALRRLLETVRALAARRVITVFGCGGDRDSTKRPLMGTVAARLSDLTIITSDNPRSEDPLAIIEEIETGIARGSGAADYRVIADRAHAIAEAIRDASPGDTVVIAGKGHERTQVVGLDVLPFNDVAEARAALAERAAHGGRRGGNGV